MNLFDYGESQRRKLEGMDQAAEARPGDLELARRVAREIAEAEGEVHLDAIMRVMIARYSIATLGNAAGSVFRGGDWVFTGRRIKSARVQAHSNELKVWRLK